MQFNLNRDIAMWLDSVRGDCSRQQYITLILRQHMQYKQDTEATKENYDQKHHSDGATHALSQV